jgi:hypothetical protein
MSRMFGGVSDVEDARGCCMLGVAVCSGLLYARGCYMLGDVSLEILFVFGMFVFCYFSGFWRAMSGRA